MKIILIFFSLLVRIEPTKGTVSNKKKIVIVENFILRRISTRVAHLKKVSRARVRASN